MGESEIIGEYGSNIINILIFPLIGAVVGFMGIVPFIIAGFDVSIGVYVYAIVTILLGLGLIVFPFTYQFTLMPTKIIYKRLWGEKEVSLQGVVGVGEVEQRVMNGNPIAINKVQLQKEDGSFFTVSLRNIGLKKGQEVIQYISENIPIQ